MPSRSHEVLAPRPTGGIGRYRVFEDFQPPLVVDSDRAYAEAHLLGSLLPRFRLLSRLWNVLSMTVFLGGFVSLIWWHWWVVPITLFASFAMYRGAKLSCADAVRDLVLIHPDLVPLLSKAGLVQFELPGIAVRE
jgi:hypothetical protein